MEELEVVEVDDRLLGVPGIESGSWTWFEWDVRCIGCTPASWPRTRRA